MEKITEKVFFSGPDLPPGMVLEGVLEWPQAFDAPMQTRGEVPGVVVAHPHPLHGATMEQIVVRSVARCCQRRGLATLRFNFRGVGQSGGRYSGVEEHRDVEAAVSFLVEKLGGAGAPEGSSPVVGLAGYSFGSVMAARAAAGKASIVRALALITFPAGWGELPPDTMERLASYPGPILALCAEYDDIAPPEQVDKALAGIGADYRLEVIPGVGHFLEGKEQEVGEKVAAFFAQTLISKGEAAVSEG